MGRPKGSLNADKAAFAEKLASVNADPTLVLAAVAKGELPCTCCDTKNKVSMYSFLVWAECDDPDVMHAASSSRQRFKCPYCAGTGLRILEASEQMKAAQTLLDRLVPKLAAKKVEKSVKRWTVSNMGMHDPDSKEYKDLRKKAQQIENGEEGA